MERRRVVITGVGAITPLGNNVNEFWNSLLEGISGADFITHFDASKFKTKFACEVKNFDPANYFDRKELRKYDLVTTYGIVAANQAIQDANIKIDNLDPYRVGVIWSSGIGGIITFFQEVKNFVEGDGTPRFNPFFVPKMIIDITAGHISMIHGFKGPNYATVSACASSANAIVDAVLLIRHGYADVIVTGGCEAAITEPGMGGFNSMNAISVRNDDPKTASRPFDKDRDGFVMGEGAAGLIIEDLEHAKKRGAKIYSEILGFGLSADAYHITAPHPEGEGAKHAMSFTLQDASIEKEKIDHINTHGTATPAGDIAEAKAIVSVFGDHAQNISINSTKSMHGHLLGAAGAIEALATILSIQNDAVPPTINHFTDDPDIPKLDFTFNHKKERIVHYAISNTFGFGGHNVSLLFGKYSE
jgi:3-oxoacyl-[acyl-carrier-protein] synthase II